MAYRLDLPARFQGWTVKIQDNERLEPPHVTLRRRELRWRIGLRDGEFLDERPPPREVPVELLTFLGGRLDELRRAWDQMYPENPVEPRRRRR